MLKLGSSTDQSIQTFQKTIIGNVLLAIAILALIPVAMLFFGADTPQIALTGVLQIGGYSLVLFMLLVKRYLPARVLALTLIGISIILAGSVMYYRGFISVGPFYLLVAIGVAASILEKQTARLVLLLSILTLLLVPVITLAGKAPASGTILQIVSNPSFVWIRTFTYAFFSILLFFVIAKMREFFLASIRELELQDQTLVQFNEELTASEEEIRSQLEALTAKDAQLHQVSRFDRLTGLPNREHFMQRTSEKLAKEQLACMAIFIIDLDGLNKINNSLGHAAGDIILREMALRISAVARCKQGGDFLARLGGDEFALTCCPENAEDLKKTAQAIINAVNLPAQFNSAAVRMTASIGVAIFPQDGVGFDDLVKKADTALYCAKHEGKNTFKLFDATMEEEFNQRISLETAIPEALARGEILAHYQPILHPDKSSLRGFEVLMRWNSPRHGQVSPSVFIPLLEQSKLIIPFGAWILEEACRQAQKWNSAADKPLIIAVNISSVQLLDQYFLDKVKEILAATGLAPSCLELEITESTLIESFNQVVEKLNQLRALGISLSLDDFGTGYSSLNYLRLLPIDNLKIDQSFVEDLNNTESEVSIIGSIISLAHDLKLKVIAEGVENQAQLDYLLTHGCDYLQGFFFAQPMDQAAASELAGKWGRPTQ